MGSQGHLDQIGHGKIHTAFLCVCLCMAAFLIQMLAIQVSAQAETLPYQDAKQTERDAKNQKAAGARRLQSLKMQKTDAFGTEAPVVDNFFSDTAATPQIASEEDVLNSLMGLQQQTDWLTDTGGADTQGNSAVLDIMKSYVNVVNVPGAQPFGGRERANSPSESGDRGIAMSLADSLQGPLISSLVTDILRPDAEGDLITFSLFGFGNFLLFGDQQSGGISMLNMQNGEIFSLRSDSNYSAKRPRAPAPGYDGSQNQSGSTPSSTSPLPRGTPPAPNIIAWIVGFLGTPLAIISYLCIFGIWAFYKIANRVL